MAPTEGRVAKPERRWDCRHGTPAYPYKQLTLSRLLTVEHHVLIIDVAYTWT